ncbi:MAG: site-2 protease family protein [Candidatus Omnitrophica bacterium]|nr:site-2 protease family protein [Candidatus Omnitrophota bacterium]MDD5027311.1 site-2 protease family protein [Candidatus Omnitrophota bacterium]MDD5661947.1 site-2 protease family protein [Candidatus Omnitrophota bacterium]
MNLPARLFSFLILFGLLIIAMSAHEFAHGLTAYRLGDPTAKYSGRLTLNPLAHIDIFWTFLLPLFLFLSSGFVFGAAKPVPINYWALKNPKRDIILVGASGPLANFILGGLLAVIIKIIPFPASLLPLIVNLIVINVILGVFNLVPIPPLDGSRILMGLLPEPLALRYARIEPYAFIILIILIWLGALNWIVWPAVGFILRLMGV